MHLAELCYEIGMHLVCGTLIVFDQRTFCAKSPRIAEFVMFFTQLKDRHMVHSTLPVVMLILDT